MIFINGHFRVPPIQLQVKAQTVTGHYDRPRRKIQNTIKRSALTAVQMRPTTTTGNVIICRILSRFYLTFPYFVFNTVPDPIEIESKIMELIMPVLPKTLTRAAICHLPRQQWAITMRAPLSRVVFFRI